MIKVEGRHAWPSERNRENDIRIMPKNADVTILHTMTGVQINIKDKNAPQFFIDMVIPYSELQVKPNDE